MRRAIVLPLLALPLLTACWTGLPGEDFDLTRTPFGNFYIDRADATLAVRTADGYTCPDGTEARIYFVDPAGEAAEPRPLAVLFAGRNFDYINAQGEHQAADDRLTTEWAAAEVEALLGLRDEAAEVTGLHAGAWAGHLLQRGFSLAVPANCWGDLWHGRGDNDFAGEDFLRYGAYFASDTVRLAQARPPVADDRLLVIGLGEGGRAVTELILDGVEIDAVAIDSSPDWLAPVVNDTAANRAYVQGLLRIYAGEVGAIEDPDAQLEALRTALRRDSMVHTVQDLGFRAPIVYGYSSADERIDVETSRPAGDAIGVTYPAGTAQVNEWLCGGAPCARHAPSNTDENLTIAALDFLVPSI